MLMVRGDNFLETVPVTCSFNGVPYDEAIWVLSNAVVTTAQAAEGGGPRTRMPTSPRQLRLCSRGPW